MFPGTGLKKRTYRVNGIRQGADAMFDICSAWYLTLLLYVGVVHGSIPFFRRSNRKLTDLFNDVDLKHNSRAGC